MTTLYISAYQKSRFVERDFAGIDEIVSDRSLNFIECANLPARIISRVAVRFSNCEMLKVPYVSCREIRFDRVRGFSEYKTENYDPAKSPAIIFRSCHDLEKITGDAKSISYLWLSSCSKFQSASPNISLRAEYRYCPSLRGAIKSESVTLLNCRGEETIEVEVGSSFLASNLLCKRLIVRLNSKHKDTRTYTNINGKSNIRFMEIETHEMQITHSQVREIKLAPHVKSINLECPRLERINIPNTYARLVLRKTPVVVPMPADPKADILLLPPHQNQKNYLMIYENDMHYFVAYRTIQGRSYCRFLDYERRILRREVFTGTDFLRRTYEGHAMPLCAMYKNGVRRRIAIFLNGAYEDV